jgi:hypothetical protein
MRFSSPFAAIRERYRKDWRTSLYIIFAALMVLMLLEIKNHRFRSSDFKVYYRAAERLAQGENLYRPDLDGHYYYKYSPTAAAYFIPVTAVPIQVGKVLHWIIMAVVACFGFYLALSMVRPGFSQDDPRVINNTLLLLALILGVHLEMEFFLGQVNHILLVLYLVMIVLLARGRDVPAAFIWAGSIFLKPFGLIFLPYFAVKGKFRLILYGLIFLALFALLPLPFTGADNFPGQYRHWFHELSVELSTKQSLLAPENDTIFSVLARYTPLRLLEFTPAVTRGYQLVVLGLIGLLFLFLISRGKNLRDSHVMEAGFLIALIPLFSFTNHYAFQFVELAAFVVVFNFSKLSKLWKYVAVAGLVFVGMNMHDLWGPTVWKLFADLSLVAVGAVLVQAVLVNLRFRAEA